MKLSYEVRDMPVDNGIEKVFIGSLSFLRDHIAATRWEFGEETLTILIKNFHVRITYWKTLI